MTWIDWKKAIRAAIDGEPAFNRETDEITFFDVVSGETLSLIQHTVGDTLIWGVQSTKGEDTEE